MNAVEAQLLQSSLQHMGDSFGRSRQMDMESKNLAERLALEKEMQRTQQDHWKKMETEQSEHNALVVKKMEEATKLKENLAKFSQAQKDLQTSGATLANWVSSAKNPDEIEYRNMVARKHYAESIDSMPGDLKNAILQNPSVRSLYRGDIGFESLSSLIQKQNSSTDPELLKLQRDRDDLTEQYINETDPAKQEYIKQKLDENTAMAKKITSFAPHPLPPTSITSVKKIPARPAVEGTPAYKKWGIFPRPAVPGTPEIPEQIITKKSYVPTLAPEESDPTEITPQEAANPNTAMQLAQTEPEAAPLSPASRKPNTIYRTPRGNMKWTGTGWIPMQ